MYSLSSLLPLATSASYTLRGPQDSKEVVACIMIPFEPTVTAACQTR